MTKMKLLGATAVAATMLTGSAMAQAVVGNPGRCEAQFPNANCQNFGPGNPYTSSGYRHHRVSYRQDRGDYNDWNRTHTGFWPTDVAGDVAGAAIGTAGAIATAPFRAMDNSYAYDIIAVGTTAATPSATASSARPAPGSRATTAAATSASKRSHSDGIRRPPGRLIHAATLIAGSGTFQPGLVLRRAGGQPGAALPASSKRCRLSSAVEQRFCKPKVGGSIPSAGTSAYAPRSVRSSSARCPVADARRQRL